MTDTADRDRVLEGIDANRRVAWAKYYAAAAEADALPAVSARIMAALELVASTYQVADKTMFLPAIEHLLIDTLTALPGGPELLQARWIGKDHR